MEHTNKNMKQCDCYFPCLKLFSLVFLFFLVWQYDLGKCANLKRFGGWVDPEGYCWLEDNLKFSFG